MEVDPYKGTISSFVTETGKNRNYSNLLKYTYRNFYILEILIGIMLVESYCGQYAGPSTFPVHESMLHVSHGTPSSMEIHDIHGDDTIS